MSILDTAVSRTPFGEHDGRSGARLERVVLAGGERLVVKRTNPATDLLHGLTGDLGGREYPLWRAGLLDRLPPDVGHAVIDGWREADETVLVMRDLGDTVLDWDHVLTGPEITRLLTAFVSLHTATAATHPPESQLMRLTDRIGMLAPTRMRALAGRFPLADAVLTGWRYFADMVDADVAAAVGALLDDPTPLASALARRPCAMIHGDLWPVNIALTDGPVVLLDWDLATWAPPAVDLASFLAGAGAANLAVSREAVIDEYRRLCGPTHDEVALALALLGGLTDFGWNKALDAATATDPADRERHRLDLDWWVQQARPVLRSSLSAASVEGLQRLSEGPLQPR
jgi:hypothetical protein